MVISVSEADRRRREVVARLFAPDGTTRSGLKDARPLQPAEVAALFRVSERAIRVWAVKGELPHMRTLGGGRLLYPADAIAALMAERYPDALPGPRGRARATAGSTNWEAS